jgi:hypothetical protein
VNESPRNQVVYVARHVDGVEGDKMRADIVRLLLQQTVSGLKTQLDPATWVSAGWVELEAFVDALCGRGIHPALAEWTATRANGGRPEPSTRESYARRLVVLFCEALQRTGLNGRAARRFAAKELGAAGLFGGTLSPRMIEHWREQVLPLTPSDELLAATGFAAAGGQPHRIAIYFVGLCHLTWNATTTVVREGTQEPPGYIGCREVGKE